MSLTAIDLCSKALIKVGALEISSFEDDTVEAIVASQFYGLVKENLLSSYPWSFSLKSQELNMLNTVPIADFSYAFQLPNDFIRAVSAGGCGASSGIEYKIFGDELHANSGEVILTYIYNVGEANFPPYFQSAMVEALAAEFCLPLTENQSRAGYLLRSANNLAAKARTLDAQQETPKSVRNFSLIDVRN